MMKKTLTAAALTVAATLLASGAASASPAVRASAVPAGAGDPLQVFEGVAEPAASSRFADFWAFVPIQFVEELLGEWTAIGHDTAHDEARSAPNSAARNAR